MAEHILPLMTDNAGDFRGALPHGGRLMGLDMGSKTIGVAFCDAGWSFASPYKTLPRGKFSRDKAALEALVNEQQVKGIIIGLPLNMDGSDFPQTQSTRAFARNIRALGLPIFLQDERWSSQAVDKAMIAADLSRKKRAARIDSDAAAHILQTAIDRLVMG